MNVRVCRPLAIQASPISGTQHAIAERLDDLALLLEVALEAGEADVEVAGEARAHRPAGPSCVLVTLAYRFPSPAQEQPEANLPRSPAVSRHAPDAESRRAAQ